MEGRSPGEAVVPGTERNARKGARFVYLAAIVAHVALGSFLAAYALTLSAESLEILAAESLVILMLVLTLVYMHNFGWVRRGPAGTRAGPVGVSRGYLLLLMWAVLGFLAVLVSLGSALSPSDFVDFLLAWWALAAFFFAVFAVWRRQTPIRWS